MRSSVIIAAHNEGSALWKTVGSCLETCRGTDFELIVSDDASSDRSIRELERRFPEIRIVASDERKGAASAKALGAAEAAGDVLVFLDGHCKPEQQAVEHMVAAVERLDGQAIVVPAVAVLDVEKWKSCSKRLGHGYHLRLEDFHSGWHGLQELRSVHVKGRKFYESPSLIGCAFTISRNLYDELWGSIPGCGCGVPRISTWGSSAG